MGAYRRVLVVMLVFSLGMGLGRFIQGAQPAVDPAPAVYPQAGRPLAAGPPSPLASNWVVEQVDAKRYTRGTGERSLALDAAGRPHLVYGQVYYAWHDGTAWQSQKVADGEAATLALNRDSRPDIAYVSSGAVMLARHDGTAWQIERVDDGVAPALALDALDRPHLSYDGLYGIQYAWFDGTAWNTETVAPGHAGPSSLALDSAGYPHLAYSGPAGLYYAHYDGTSWSTTTVDSLIPVCLSLALDAAGRPHIAYQKAQVYYAHLEGTSWVTETVDAYQSYVDAGVSLVMDSAGRPHLSYSSTESVYDLLYAYHDGTNWVFTRIDSGWNSSLALGVDGSPQIGYGAASTYPWATLPVLYARYDGAAWHTETVDVGSGPVGGGASMALDAAGHPHFGYGERLMSCINEYLRYAVYDGTTWSLQQVGCICELQDTSLALDAAAYPHLLLQTGGVWGELVYRYSDGSSWFEEALAGGVAHSALALDERDQPRAAYSTAQGLWYAIRDMDGWHAALVDATAPNADLSLALDSSGQPHLSYATAPGLYYSYLDQGLWITELITMSYGVPSMALDSAGQPHVAYVVGGLLYYAHREGVDWVSEEIDSVVIGTPSLAVDAYRWPHVAYHKGGSLYYAHYAGGPWWTETVSDWPAGGNLTLLLDTSGAPHIGFSDASQGRVLWAHDTGCTPMTEVAIEGPSAVPQGIGADYGVTFAPPTATLPAVTWDNGALGYFQVYSWTMSGSYTLSVTATSPCATAYATKTVSVFCQPVQEAEIQGPVYPLLGIPAFYTATYSPPTSSLPLTTTWDNGTTGLYAAYFWAQTGTYTVSLTAANCGVTVGAAQPVTVLCQPPVTVALAGPPATLVDQPTLYEVAVVPITASRPLTLTWNNGASGPSAVYTWPTTGTYTVTVTATNPCGETLRASRSVRVLAEWPYQRFLPLLTRLAGSCTSVDGASISGPELLLVGQEGLYTATYTPAEATIPVRLTWDNGRTGPTMAYSWTLPGTYALAVTVTNACGNAAAGLGVTVVALCAPVQTAVLSGPVVLPVGETGHYTATAGPPTATLPLTLTWDHGAVGPTAAYSWTLPGLYTLTVTATNPCGEVSATLAVSVTPAVCRPVQTVVITGPRAPCTDLPYLYTATVSPPTATVPLTVTWDNGSVGLTAVYSWTAMGGYTLTVTATNACGQAHGELHVLVCPGVAVRGPALDIVSCWLPSTGCCVERWCSAPFSRITLHVFTFHSSVSTLSQEVCMAINIVREIDDLVPIRRVLLSVSDKAGLDVLIPGLVEINPEVRFYSTGGTYAAIAALLGETAGRHLTQVADYTGQPETQGGLVKTLDFKIYLGLLTERYNAAHQADLARTGAVPLDMVVVNLYPFQATVARAGVTVEEARANIDIGGPCMLRAAAKNYLRVAAVCDPADYAALLAFLKEDDGRLSLARRFELARRALAHTAAYDAAISAYLTQQEARSVARAYPLRHP